MDQELVTLTQPTAYDIPLLAGGHLRIPHAANAAHDIANALNSSYKSSLNAA